MLVFNISSQMRCPWILKPVVKIKYIILLLKQILLPVKKKFILLHSPQDVTMKISTLESLLIMAETQNLHLFAMNLIPIGLSLISVPCSFVPRLSVWIHNCPVYEWLRHNNFKKVAIQACHCKCPCSWQLYESLFMHKTRPWRILWGELLKSSHL
jgi:hypothetical protein